MKNLFFFFCFFHCAVMALPAMAETAEISLKSLKKHGLHAYVEESRSRVLVEGENHDDQALFLLDVPYALVRDKFVGLPEPLKVEKGEIYFSRSTVELYLFPFLAKAEQAAILKDSKEVPRETGGDLRCTSARPVVKVFLDPGHGGADLGTKFGSLFEKNVTLKVSVLVAEELRRRGFTVSFSRTKDVFLPLDIRSDLAKQWQADIFISIHMNSAPAKDAHGTETYILSADSTDAAARKLALIENSIAVHGASGKQSAVQDILWDMEQTTYLQDSAFLASYIQKQIIHSAQEQLRGKKWNWTNRGVRQAPFFVLSRAAMPAVLVEIGYLSNAQDRKLLTDKNFQESLAKAVANGVKQYQEVCKAR